MLKTAYKHFHRSPLSLRGQLSTLPCTFPRRFTSISPPAYRKMSTIHIAGERIPVTATYPEINVSAVLEFAPFKEWADAMSNEKSQSAERNNLEIKKIEIQNVDYFGSKIGFVKFKVDARLVDNGKNVPGIIFMVVLILLQDFCVGNRFYKMINNFPNSFDLQISAWRIGCRSPNP